MNVPFFRPSITENEIGEVTETLRSGWLTTGPRVKRFEAEFATAVGASHAVAVNSCTAALHLALEAIGIKAGDIVAVPVMTFAATAEVVRYFDATPLFVDCDETLCMDHVALAETLEAISSGKAAGGIKLSFGHLKAVIPMHYGGYCCNMDEIARVANEYGLTVIEDAAHAFPAGYLSCQHGWRNAGTMSAVGCFSFYANKCITTGEGGMAITDNHELAERMRLMSLHGMNNNAWQRFTDKGSWYYEIVAPGYKYNLTDIAAAIGLQQLKKADEFRDRRELIARRYTERFLQISEIQTPDVDQQTRKHAWHLYHIRLNLARLKIDRARFIDELKQRGISCSVHWQPLHLQPYYRDKYGLEEGLFPMSEREWTRLVSLPIFPDMTDEEIDYVISTVKKVVNEYKS